MPGVCLLQAYRFYLLCSPLPLHWHFQKPGNHIFYPIFCQCIIHHSHLSSLTHPPCPEWTDRNFEFPSSNAFSSLSAYIAFSKKLQIHHPHNSIFFYYNQKSLHLQCLFILFYSIFTFLKNPCIMDKRTHLKHKRRQL